MKNILITGAAGFLGSHLMLHHLNQKDRVLGIDNYCSSESNSDHVLEINHQGGQIKRVDITCVDHVNNTVNDWSIDYGKFDLIYNFACPASPPKYQAMPIETMMTCTLGTNNILNIAHKHNACVVHASTSEVYGDPNISPQSEIYRGCVNSYGPRSCYDEGKRAAEALCYDYLYKYQTDVRLVRIFNTYGPHMDPYDGRVISNFIVQALKNQKLTVYGDGTQTRSFCYVDDLINGIVAMGELKTNLKTPVNIGNPNEFTMIELADLIVKKIMNTSSESMIEHHLLPIDDPLQRKPDIKLANDILKWSPNVDLNQGLDKTIQYFRKSLNLR